VIQEWRETQLNELIDIKHGFAFKGEYFTDEPTNDLLLTPGNFSVGGGFQWGKYKFYDGPIPTEYILTEGDLVVSMTDLSKAGDTLGYSAMVPPSEYLLLHNQRIGKVIKKSESIDALYLNYQLRTKTYRNEILASATGSTVRHTSPTKIGAYRFLLPPLDEQKSIASVLGALDDKIQNNRRMNETLEEMARTIFKSWFVDFDPVDAKATGNAPAHMNADTAALFPSSFGDDGLPEGWVNRPLDEIAEFLNGAAMQKFPSEGREFLPVIKIAELRSGLSSNTNRASLNVPEKYVISDGDVLFAWSGSLMQKVWTEGKGALNQHLFKVTSDNYQKWFFFYWIDHHMKWFQSIAASKATTMGHIQRKHLSEAEVCVPNESIMNCASDVISPLLEKQTQNSIESRTLAELRDTLLPKLMSGEIRVADAEREVEAAV